MSLNSGRRKEGTIIYGAKCSHTLFKNNHTIPVQEVFYPYFIHDETHVHRGQGVFKVILVISDRKIQIQIFTRKQTNKQTSFLYCLTHNPAAYF